MIQGCAKPTSTNATTCSPTKGSEAQSPGICLVQQIRLPPTKERGRAMRRREDIAAPTAYSQPQLQPGGFRGLFWFVALVAILLANDIRIAVRVSATRCDEPVLVLLEPHSESEGSSRYTATTTTSGNNSNINNITFVKNHQDLLLPAGENDANDNANGNGDDPRRFNVILNYRVEVRVIAITDDFAGQRERISGYSERLEDVSIGEERSGKTDMMVELHTVDQTNAQMSIQSQRATTTATTTRSAAAICDYHHHLRVPMTRRGRGGSLFGTTNEFRRVATCSHDGMTYNVMLQVSVMEKRHQQQLGKAYDVSFMNHAINYEYDFLEGTWQRVERSNTYKVRNLSAGRMVQDPLEPEHKKIVMLEDGPGYVVIEINFDNSDDRCHYKYFMTIAMEENGMGFSNGMEALNPCSNTSGDKAYAMLLHAFVVEV